jgi:hypothetical protein
MTELETETMAELETKKGGFGNEDNDRVVMNNYLLGKMWLEDAGGGDDDEVTVGDGSGDGGGGVDEAEAEAVDVANEAVAFAFSAMTKEADGPPLLPDELADAVIFFMLVWIPIIMFLNWQFDAACCWVHI